MAVRNVRPEFTPFLDAANWDWYQATVSYRDFFYLKPFLEKAFPNADWRSARPQNGYTNADELHVAGRRVLLVCYGGNNDTANICSTSSDAIALGDAFREWGGSFKPTRLDSCIDWEESGLFNAISSSLIQFAKENDLKIRHDGDWSRGISRTLYIGSASSPVQLRLYEKGYEVSGIDTDRPDWVRLEVQVRPAKDRRSAASSWLPSDLFGAGWVAKAVDRFFLIPTATLPIGYVKQDTDRLKRRAWISKIGARALREWLEDCGGDSAMFTAQVVEAVNE